MRHYATASNGEVFIRNSTTRYCYAVIGQYLDGERFAASWHTTGALARKAVGRRFSDGSKRVWKLEVTRHISCSCKTGQRKCHVCRGKGTIKT